MAHSFTNLLYHIIFATKDREPWLDDAWRPELYRFVMTTVTDQGGITLAVNGMTEHLHLFAKLRPDQAVSEVIAAVKSRSSGWIHRTRPDLAAFAWQTGYGAFTVSQSQAPKVVKYIQRQQEHHRDLRFDQEYRTILRKNGYEGDESFFWE